MKQQQCAQCQRTFTPSRGPSKNRRQKFCSIECTGIAQRGKSHYNYKGGSVWRGYRFICVGGSRIPEHRHVMETHLNRKLLDSEVIHHKNHDKLDNRVENLEILPSQSIHAQLHADVFRSETHRQCTTCLTIKPRTEFDRGPNKKNFDPNFTQCKTCRKSYFAARYKAGLTTLQRKGRAKWNEFGFSCCKRCKSNSIPHRAMGLCDRCYYHHRKSLGLSH